VAHPLDNPALESLLGPHAHFAQRRSGVLRYPPDVSPFAAMPAAPDPADWLAAAELVGPSGTVLVSEPRREPPPGWGFDALIDVLRTAVSAHAPDLRRRGPSTGGVSGNGVRQPKRGA
jgi:hypothetical protein